MNSGLLFANHACACKTVVLKNYFQILFRISKKKKKKNGKGGNPRTDISALKSVSDFAFDYKSEIRILNLSTSLLLCPGRGAFLGSISAALSGQVLFFPESGD